MRLGSCCKLMGNLIAKMIETSRYEAKKGRLVAFRPWQTNALSLYATVHPTTSAGAGAMYLRKESNVKNEPASATTATPHLNSHLVLSLATIS